MDKLRSFAKLRTNTVFVVVMCVLCSLAGRGRLLRAQSAGATSGPGDVSALIADYRRVEVASVSDALEQLTGRRMFMTHRMQPIFTTKFAGFARTVQLKKDEGNKDPTALSGMLAAIDQGSTNSVYVMAAEDGADIAGMGGKPTMGTAMAARGYAGAVIDGGVRDTKPICAKIEFPVFSLRASCSTSVGHYRFAGAQIAVTCDGVTVNPGDIVVADSDGVVVVPAGKAAEVLKSRAAVGLQGALDVSAD